MLREFVDARVQPRVSNMSGSWQTLDTGTRVVLGAVRFGTAPSPVPSTPPTLMSRPASVRRPLRVPRSPRGLCWFGQIFVSSFRPAGRACEEVLAGLEPAISPSSVEALANEFAGPVPPGAALWLVLCSSATPWPFLALLWILRAPQPPLPLIVFK